jgi:hypothetical protein
MNINAEQELIIEKIKSLSTEIKNYNDLINKNKQEIMWLAAELTGTWNNVYMKPKEA